jgi:hypothetical protein
MPAVSEKQKRFMDAAAHNPDFAKKAGVPTSVAKEFSEKSKNLKFGAGTLSRSDSQTINNPKTNHGEKALFKKGGSTMAKNEMHSEKGEMKKDVAQDKKLIKRAFGMHDKQSHEGKRTDLSKLAMGGMSNMSAGAAAHARKEGRKVAKEMEYDYKTGKKSFRGSTAAKDAHAEKEGRRVAKDMEYDYSKGRMPMMAKGGLTMKETMGPRTMSKDVEKGSNKLTKFGESAVQKRGHTKGAEPKMPKFARGGGVESKGKTKGKMITMCGGGMYKK